MNQSLSFPLSNCYFWVSQRCLTGRGTFNCTIDEQQTIVLICLVIYILSLREKVFGPVLTVLTFRTAKEGIALANNTNYGLGGSVWTENLSLALEVALSIKAGSVWVNGHNLFDAAAGFGGYRESGFGRDGGKEVMRTRSHWFQTCLCHLTLCTVGTWVTSWLFNIFHRACMNMFALLGKKGPDQLWRITTWSHLVLQFLPQWWIQIRIH